MMRSCCCPPSAAPPTSVLSSKRPASTGLASASPAKRSKKRAFTSPFHEFCQELRPLLPASLRNSEREKLLGMAWKGLSATERRKFEATPMPTLNSGAGEGWHEGYRVAWAHVSAPQLQLTAPAPAPQLQLTAPAPAPQLQLAAPPAPQLQLITAPQLQLTSAVMLPPPAPTAAPVLLPCMPRLSYPAAPTPAPPVPPHASELLTTAAAHRTFVELTQLCLEVQQQLMEEQVEEDEQQQLAGLMEEQMTGEDAVDIAISLGMPH